MKKMFLVAIFICMAISSFAQNLYLYGGSNGKVFMGCINSSPYDSESIWNAYGDYGNKFNSTCIWNSFGDYGNPFSSYSPWNSASTNPPGIYDSKGVFYGYLTRNKYLKNRAESKLTDMICDFYDMIPDDVSKWYDKLFNDLGLQVRPSN